MPLDTLKAAADKAVEFGFTHAGVLDVGTMKLYKEIRDMCNPKDCKTYGTNWTCPPESGTLEENTAILRGYSGGIIVQSMCVLEGPFDSKGMMEGGKLHQKRFRAFRKEILDEFPAMLALGAGGCNLCKECTYPDSPCRFPDEALSSMEAFGIYVSEVCKQNGLKAHYPHPDGKQTLTYVGCYLLETA